jgi:hypothetical protein
MKALIQNAGYSIFMLAAFCGDALARPCGASPLPACEVPEPSSPLLFIVAAAAVGVVLKMRKK